jgi:signal transduction histidine kinase
MNTLLRTFVFLRAVRSLLRSAAALWSVARCRSVLRTAAFGPHYLPALPQWVLYFTLVFCVQACWAQSPGEPLTLDILKDKLKTALKENNTTELGQIYRQLGEVYSQNPRTLSEGLEAYLLSYRYYGVAKDSVAMFEVGRRLSQGWMRQRRFDLAIEQLQKAEGYYQRTRRNKDLARTHALLAQVNNVAGDSVATTIYQQSAIQLAKTESDSSLRAELVHDLSVIYFKRNNIDSASTLVYEGLQLSLAINNEELIRRCMQTLGMVFLAKKSYTDAVYYLQQSLNYMPKRGDNPFERRDTYRFLAQAFEALEQKDESLRYLNSFVALNDSLQDIGQLEIMSRFSDEFNLRNKEATIAALNQEKTTIQSRYRRQLYIFISLILIGATILFFVYKFYRQRLRYSQTILQQQEEINRRRLVELENQSRLQSMQSMVLGQETERSRIARDLHDSLGGLLSTAKLQLDGLALRRTEFAQDKGFQKALSIVNESCQEVRHLAHQMQPVALANLGIGPAVNDLLNKAQSEQGPQITLQVYDIDPNLDNSIALTAYRIIQELVQNVVKHAQAKHMLVQLSCTDNQLAILVEDDGQGFDQNQVARGMGLDNIFARARFVGGSVEIDSSVGEGTTIYVWLPIQTKTA